MSKVMNAREYLGQVEKLLSDIDSDDRASLLADLADQLDDMPDGEAVEILGTPEEFAAEYRRSAGITHPVESRSVSMTFLASVVSLVLIPIGCLLLLSMGGGQFLFGPAVIVVGWVLARVTPAPIRLAWSIVVGLLGGQILLLSLNLVFGALPQVVAVVSLIATLVLIKVFWDTTANGRPDPAGPRRSVVGATLVGAVALIVVVPMLVQGTGALRFVLSGTVLAVAGVVMHMFLTGGSGGGDTHQG